MNELIKELAEQARYDARNEKHYLERVHNREFTVDEYQEIYDRKFAELIVRGCAKAFEAEVDTWKQMDPYQGSIKRQGAKAIKQHFGVEE